MLNMRIARGLIGCAGGILLTVSLSQSASAQGNSDKRSGPLETIGIHEANCQNGIGTDIATVGTLAASEIKNGSNSPEENLAFVQNSLGDPNAAIVSCTQQGSGKTGSWTSSSEVTHIVVKAADVRQLIDVTDGTSGNWSTQCIINNGGQQPDISGLYCYGSGGTPPVRQVKVKFKKEVTGTTDPWSFSFTSNEVGDFALTENSPETGFYMVNAGGAVSVTETENAGFDLASFTCGDPSNALASQTFDVNSRTLTFTVEDNANIQGGEEVVCTAKNDRTPNEGVVRVVKVVEGDGAELDKKFSFKATIDGQETPFSLAAQDPAQTFVISADHTSVEITEQTDPNYEFKGVSCTNGASSSTATTSFKAHTDEDITCTFRNEIKVQAQNPTLKVKKIVAPSDTGQMFVFNVGNQAIVQLGHNEMSVPVQIEVGKPYTVSESVDPDYKTSIDCGAFGSAQDTTSIIVTPKSASDEIVCTFTNFKENDDPAEDVTKVFIHRRVDNLLTHGPDRARVLRRLDEQPTGSLKDEGSYEPLKFTGSIKDGKGDVKFSTSLSQMRAAAAAAGKKKISEAGLSFNDTYAGYYAPQVMTQRLDLWVEGQMTSYDDTAGGINRDGNFRILYTGMDYAITPGILIGGLIQIDHTDEDVNNPNLKGTVEGTGWMAGPYLGLKLQESLFFDARAAWGKSSNDIDLTDNVVGRRTGSFETDRWLATATLTGNYYHEGLRISPHVGVAYGNEVSDAYKTSLGQNVGAADVTLGKVTFGPEFGYRTTLENGTTVEPHISLKGIWNFDGDTLQLSSGPVKIDDFRAQIEGGVIVKSVDGYSFRAAGSYDGIGDSNLDAWSAKGWLNIPLD